MSAVAMQVARGDLRAAPDQAFTVDAGPNGRLAPRKIDYPFLRHAVFREFVLDPRLVDLASWVLGRPAFLIRDQLFCKPPEFGSAKPYHQENAALGFTPPGDMVVTWIALDDVTEANGCLRFIDGSHLNLLPHAPLPGARYHLVPPPGLVDLTRESVVPVRAGAVVLFHSQVLHGSHANRSATWRRGYSAHWVTDRAACAGDALRHGYSHTVGHGDYRHRSP